jgi:aspartyl-tRNA(Asn)/glutamyl-tRNA(Gln) amidotransferase subunit C
MTHPKVDQALVRELCDLARLRLSGEAEQQAAARLDRILATFAALQAVPTDGVAPSPHPTQVPLLLRPDTAGPCLSQQEVLANAPASAAGCFLVPRTVEG